MNNSSNTTSYPTYAVYDQAAAVLYFILFILIVPLNILVICTLLKKEHRQSRLHYFILHMAIADLLVGLINVLGDGIQSSMLGAWYGGDVTCRIWRYLKVVLSIASNDLLIGLSIDRFLAIAFPMMAMKRGSRLYKALVIGSWILGLVVAVFFLPYSKGINGEDGFCIVQLPEDWWRPYIIIVSLAVYVLPTVIITVCYIGICIVIRRRWKESQSLSELHLHTSEETDGHLVTSSGLLTKAKVRSIKMTLVICLAFFLCWTPYFVLTVLSVFHMYVSHQLYTVLGALYCLNSLCNPLVFILFNTDKFKPSQVCGEDSICSKVLNEEPFTLVSFG